MKKTIRTLVAILAALTILLSFAACKKDTNDAEDAKTTDSATASAQDAEDAKASEDDTKASEAEEVGQNPVMNFTGDYINEDLKCKITIEAEGENNAKISVIWNQNEKQTVFYAMSGSFDDDTMRVNYSDSTKRIETYDPNGELESENTEYTDGVGRIQFYDDGTLAWQDEQAADLLAGQTFTYAD